MKDKTTPTLHLRPLHLIDDDDARALDTARSVERIEIDEDTVRFTLSNPNPTRTNPEVIVRFDVPLDSIRRTETRRGTGFLSGAFIGGDPVQWHGLSEGALERLREAFPLVEDLPEECDRAAHAIKATQIPMEEQGRALNVWLAAVNTRAAELSENAVGAFPLPTSLKVVEE